MNSKLNTTRIIELCLVFLISILSFTIGTYVGKKYSDNQQRLSILEPNKKSGEAHGEGHSEVASENHETAKDAHGAGAALTDEEIAKMAEEFSNEESTPVEDTKTETAKADTHLKNEDIGKPVEEVEEYSAHTPKKETHAAPVAAAPKKVETAKPAAAPAKDVAREVASISKKAQAIVNPNEGKSALQQYTIQVGSFPTTAEAEKVSESLKARGYKASQVKADVNGKTWFRVQVGLFDNLADAQNYKKELIEKNRLSSAIIQKLK